MKKGRFIIPLLSLLIIFSGCAGIKTFTIQTKEPARVTLPDNVRSLLIVNNTVKQPKHVGHSRRFLGRKGVKKIDVETDSLSIFFTEALTQFLNEDQFFKHVVYSDSLLRNDTDFLVEKPLSPQQMNALRQATGADAIVSLDRLLVQTRSRETFLQEGYPFVSISANIKATMRVYMPTMTGKIPTIQYADSLAWEGLDIPLEAAYDDLVIPSPKDALKELSIYGAEKMSYILSPHWIEQDRWIYTTSSSLMREGENFANQNKWNEAIVKWKQYFNGQNNSVNKAKAANNVALAYEMLDDFEMAKQWIDTAEKFMNEGTPPNSLERRRIQVYKVEIERRVDAANELNKQLTQQKEDDSYIIFK